MPTFLEVQDVRVPWLLYGTAWKEERTPALVGLALGAGFVGIDTANQRKHYFEAGVGEAIAAAGVDRARLFLQTKFTYARGQDHRLPYDQAAPVGEQVRQSFASSLDHLGVDYVDAYVLHGPERQRGWSAADREVWGAMEALHRQGHTRLLGVSNISPKQLIALCDAAEIAPAVVQNRCYANQGWDREVRAVCRERGILYEGFSLLTANSRELRAPVVAEIAARCGATVPGLVFRFAYALGIVALTGTSDAVHMGEDLRAVELRLGAADIDAIETLAG